MKGFFSLWMLDIKRLLKNSLFIVISVTLVLIIIVTLFLLPKDIQMEEHELVTLGMSEYGFDEVESMDLLYDAVDNGGIGIYLNEDNMPVIVHNGISDRNLNAIAVMVFSKGFTQIESLKLYEDQQPIPFNQRMVPVFIAFEALIVGLILVGALMLAEKEESTLLALRISPIGVNLYILSKTTLLALIGTVYALLMAITCVGFNYNFLSLIAISFFGSCIFILLGMAFSVFFKTLGEWFFSIAIILMVNMMPVMSYMMPSYSPDWIKLTPSYYILFELEKILFKQPGQILPVILSMGTWLLVSYVITYQFIRIFYLKRGGRNA